MLVGNFFVFRLCKHVTVILLIVQGFRYNTNVHRKCCHVAVVVYYVVCMYLSRSVFQLEVVQEVTKTEIIIMLFLSWDQFGAQYTAHWLNI